MSNKYIDTEGNVWQPNGAYEQVYLHDAIIKIAASQMDFAEEPRGSNWGEHVKKYLNSVGINFPAPWCMAFVYWVYNEACESLQLVNPLYKTGHVLTMWNKMDSRYKNDKPIVGGIFIKDYGGGRGHTGIVERIEDDLIHTIEGNTNDEGEREGYEVCRRKRYIKNCKGFISITK